MIKMTYLPYNFILMTFILFSCTNNTKSTIDKNINDQINASTEKKNVSQENSDDTLKEYSLNLSEAELSQIKSIQDSLLSSLNNEEFQKREPFYNDVDWVKITSGDSINNLDSRESNYNNAFLFHPLLIEKTKNLISIDFNDYLDSDSNLYYSDLYYELDEELDGFEYLKRYHYFFHCVKHGHGCYSREELLENIELNVEVELVKKDALENIYFDVKYHFYDLPKCVDTNNFKISNTERYFLAKDNGKYKIIANTSLNQYQDDVSSNFRDSYGLFEQNLLSSKREYKSTDPAYISFQQYFEDWDKRARKVGYVR